MRRLTTLVLCITAASRLSAQHEGHGPAERIGTVRFATSCDASVSSDVNRAIALIHSFEFGLSTRAFNEILARDSTCAMAYWGIALNAWTNPFVPDKRSASQLEQGRAAIARARSLAAKATERERGYIDAVALLYDDHETVDQATRVARYEQAMRALATRQPPDTEATIFHAVAVIASAPPADKSFANLREAGRTLERLYATQPNHPGLAHYIIHSYDVPPLAAKAESAATHYAVIAPSSPHALHMPSHTFTRVGWWEQSLTANRRAVDRSIEIGSIAEALHASDYSVYANLQMGRDSAAAAILKTIPALEAKFDVNALGSGASGSVGVFALAAMPARFALERRAWREAAELRPRSTPFPWTDAITHFARSLGASRIGNRAVARESLDSLAMLHQRLKSGGEPYWAEQVAIQELIARAWLLLADRRTDSALALMREAAAREDATEKAPVTPGPLAPARELLGDMLMQIGRPREALAEYRRTIAKEPNRFRALYGALQAARAAGDRKAAAAYAAELKTLCAKGERAECRSSTT
ncbi:MAG TPA: hypothetical protein VJ672_11355 [Gemmatimonadaceae bacterium]|nr:hypothetical protein [Gemmatimonadaceae bacterium]